MGSMAGGRWNCGVEATLDAIGGKWKPLILWHLQRTPERFSDLRRLIPQVTEKMLTQQLRELERDGLVVRTVHAQVPPKVEYAMSELGSSLEPVLGGMCDWGDDRIRREQAATASSRPVTARPVERGAEPSR